MAEQRKRPRQPRRNTPSRPRKERKEQSHGVISEEKLNVQFSDREAFGQFCVQLATDHVPFELAGFQTVVLAKTHLDQLPTPSAQLYQTYHKDKRIEKVFPVSRSGRRRLPTAEETERLLKELAEKY